MCCQKLRLRRLRYEILHLIIAELQYGVSLFSSNCQDSPDKLTLSSNRERHDIVLHHLIKSSPQSVSSFLMTIMITTITIIIMIINIMWPLQVMEPLIRLIKSVIRRFERAVQKNHLLLSEILFQHAHAQNFIMEIDSVYEAPAYAKYHTSCENASQHWFIFNFFFCVCVYSFNMDLFINTFIWVQFGLLFICHFNF